MLIAEAGNNHFGSMNMAKDLIRVAKDCGADAVKFQAFAPGDFEGSMPDDFYQQCALDFQEYMTLIDLGKYLKIPVFFSIFNNELLKLDHFTDYTKLAAWQTNQYDAETLAEIDSENSIVSINSSCKDLPPLKNSIILYATDYTDDDPVLERIGILEKFYRRPIGLSDHTIGIDTCKKAIDLYQVPVIEKHFTLTKNMQFGSKVFRDTVHGADPAELYELANYFKLKKQNYAAGRYHAVNQ